MSENDPASQEPTEEVLDEQTQQDHAAAQEGEAEQPSEPETRDEEMERLRGEALIAEKKVLQAQAEAFWVY